MFSSNLMWSKTIKMEQSESSWSGRARNKTNQIYFECIRIFHSRCDILFRSMSLQKPLSNFFSIFYVFLCRFKTKNWFIIQSKLKWSKKILLDQRKLGQIGLELTFFIVFTWNTLGLIHTLIILCAFRTISTYCYKI